MEYVLESNDMSDYLKADMYIDFDGPLIRKQADVLFAGLSREDEKIKAAFEFVRDVIAHSADIESDRVTKRASDVLKYKEGICFAKSFLLAALLRCAGIPAGLCYQRLTKEETPDAGYVLHGLNAVYLADKKKWLRIDARGNKAGVDAQFTGDEEKVAFEVRPEFGEADYPMIYAAPHPKAAQALEAYHHRKSQDLGISEL